MAELPENIGGGVEQNAEFSSDVTPPAIKKKNRRSKQAVTENAQGGISTIQDSEAFLMRHIDPIIARRRKILGKKALKDSITMGRQEIIKRPDGAVEVIVGEIEASGGKHLKAEFSLISSEVLSDAELIAQWPLIQKSGLAEQLELESDGEYEGSDEEIYEEEGTTLTEVVFGEPILEFVSRVITLQRGERPSYSLQAGFFYDSEPFAVYFQHDVVIDANSTDNTSDELATILQMSKHLAHSIDPPDVQDLERALKILDIT